MPKRTLRRRPSAGRAARNWSSVSICRKREASPPHSAADADRRCRTRREAAERSSSRPDLSTITPGPRRQCMSIGDRAPNGRIWTARFPDQTEVFGPSSPDKIGFVSQNSWFARPSTVVVINQRRDRILDMHVPPIVYLAAHVQNMGGRDDNVGGVGNRDNR